MNNLDYGIIGNCRSAALISKTGSIDWCCLPEFDSSSVFAKILDEKIGGNFTIVVDDSYYIKQQYEPKTAILVTTYTSGEHCFELHDFMPRYYKKVDDYHAPPEIVRYIKYISGTPKFKVGYNPKLEYAQGETTTYIKPDFIASLTHDIKFDTIFLYTSFNKEKVVNGEEIVLTENGYFLLGYNEKIFLPTTEKINLELERTKLYWLNWVFMQRK